MHIRAVYTHTDQEQTPQQTHVKFAQMLHSQQQHMRFLWGQGYHTLDWTAIQRRLAGAKSGHYHGDTAPCARVQHTVNACLYFCVHAHAMCQCMSIWMHANTDSHTPQGGSNTHFYMHPHTCRKRSRDREQEKKFHENAAIYLRHARHVIKDPYSQWFDVFAVEPKSPRSSRTWSRWW